MFKFIEKLRKKPEKKRQQIVVLSAFAITAVIALFWLIALIIRIQSSNLSIGSVDEKNLEKIGTSLEGLKNSWDSFMNNVNTTAHAIESTPTSSPDTVPQPEQATTTSQDTQ